MAVVATSVTIPQPKRNTHSSHSIGHRQFHRHSYSQSSNSASTGPIRSASRGKNSTPHPRDCRMVDNSPVDQNGSFEFDRVLKSGYVQKRTQKTKAWKPVYLVLRPTSISIYKTESESRLRHKIELCDLTAVAHLKDPKGKRDHVFGLFSPSRNYHLQASCEADVDDWVDLIRTYARIEEEEEEMFLQSPQSDRPGAALMDRMFNKKRALHSAGRQSKDSANFDRMLSSSPELQINPPTPRVNSPSMSIFIDYSGVSGNEMTSDFSDTEIPRIFVPSACASTENVVGPIDEDAVLDTSAKPRPSTSQQTAKNNSSSTLPDPDRVIWQDWLWMQRSKGGVRQWRNYWAVLRPRNLILYRDQSEYTAQFILPLGSILSAADIDPVSKTKKYCLQAITEEKIFKFCAHDEESLVQCLGAFKSLLAKRRELQARTSFPVQSQ